MKKNLYSLMSLALILAAAITATSCRNDDDIIDNGETGGSTTTTEQTITMSDLVGQWLVLYEEYNDDVDLRFDQTFNLTADGSYIYDYIDNGYKYYLRDEGTWGVEEGNYFSCNSYNMSNSAATRRSHIKSLTNNIVTFDKFTTNDNMLNVQWLRHRMVECNIPSSWIEGIWRTDSAKTYQAGVFTEYITDMLSYAKYDSDGKCYSIFNRNGEYKGYDGTWQVNGTQVIHDEDYTTRVLYIDGNKGLLTMAIGEGGATRVYYFSQTNTLPDWTPVEEIHYYTADEVAGTWKVTTDDDSETYITLNSDGTSTSEKYGDGEYDHEENTWTIQDNVISFSNGTKYTIQTLEDGTMTLVNTDTNTPVEMTTVTGTPVVTAHPELLYGNWQLANTQTYTNGSLTSTTYGTEWRVYSSDQFVNIYDQRTDDGSYVGLSTTWSLNSDWTITYGSTAFSTQRVIKANSTKLVLRKTTSDNSYQQTEYTKVSSVPSYTVGD